MNEREADYRVEDEHAKACKHDGGVVVILLCAQCGKVLEGSGSEVTLSTKVSASWQNRSEKSDAPVSGPTLEERVAALECWRLCQTGD
jgi:hypothetical protein